MHSISDIRKRRANSFRAFLFVCAADANAACTTVNTKKNGRWGHEYSGVRCVGKTKSYEGVAWATAFGNRPLALTLAGVDYLFSAVADTIVLLPDLAVHAFDDKRSHS